MVGRSTHYIDFLMMVAEGVTPPIQRAETSQILSAPAFYMAKESDGEVDMTQSIGIILRNKQNRVFYYHLQQKTYLSTMLINEQELACDRQYGRIYPLRWGYYSNPQMFMFGFTLALTVTLSVLMISSVFIGIYHKIIGSLLCLYVIYRFTSLGLSNPGLAVQSVDQLMEREIHTHGYFKENENCLKIEVENSQLSSPQQQGESPTFESQIGHNSSNLTKMGFYNFCNQCKVPIQKGTKHCKSCKTCVDGFDHHCIWIGKCIGKKNMWQFKQFLCFVFITLIYALILSIQSSKIQRIT